MSSLDAARAHLEKAREFLEAAELAADLGLINAAASNAVIAGINAKDAICLRSTGRTGKTENHDQAVAELEGSGPVGKGTRLVTGSDRGCGEGHVVAATPDGVIA